MRLARAVQAGLGEVMRTALETTPCRTPEAQWELLLPYLAEAEEMARSEPGPTRPGRPRRLLRPRRGLVIRRTRTPWGWTLHFTGTGATSSLIDELLDDIEERWGR